MDPVFVESVKEVPEALYRLLVDGDIVLSMGAGDIGAVAAGLAEILCSDEMGAQQ